VSTAARICALAEAGGILVSRSARGALGDEHGLAELRSIGARRLRGIADEIELFEVRPGS
jgi:class 3 adenylate cyclase